MAHICLMIVATAGYPPFARRLIESARKYFAPDHRRHFMVFTDQPEAFAGIPDPGDVTCLSIVHQPWPAMTLNRYQMIMDRSDCLASFDLLLYCDADMLFIGEVPFDLFGSVTAVLHPGYAASPRRALPYENRASSCASVLPHEGNRYFCGGVQGGAPAEYLAAAGAMLAAIERDRQCGIVAVWHDESHWNRYLIDHPPKTILPPLFCWPEERLPHGDAKILALLKDHHAIRQSQSQVMERAINRRT